MAKICIITEIFPNTEHKSAGIFVRDHVEILSEQHEIDVLVIRSKRSFYIEPKTYLRENLPSSVRIIEVSYLSIPRNYAPNIVFPLLFTRLNKATDLTKYDLFYVHNALPGGGIIPFIKRNYPQSKTILMIHGSDWRDKWKRFYLKKIMVTILNKVDHIWISGPTLAKQVLDTSPNSKAKLETTYNIVSPKLVNTERLQKNDARSILGWPNDSVEFICIANIAHVKGVDILVEALAMLNSSSWNRIHILGGVTDNGIMKRLTKRIYELGLEKKVLFVGTIPRHELITYYYAADLYVLPSRNEGFNVSLLEAAYVGIPAVATNCGGASLLIKNANYLPKPESISELVKSLTLIQENLNKFDAVNHFNLDFIEKYCFFNTLLGRINSILK